MLKGFRSTGLIVFLLVGGLVLAWLSGGGQGARERTPVPDHHTRPIQRVVCIHPAATEIFYDLGCADRLVAVSNFCTYPPEARNKPTVGDTMAPNLERIRMLKPDLVVVSGLNTGITRFCEEQGLRVINLHMEGIAGILEGIQRLGDLLQETEKAAKLCADTEKQLAEVRTRVAGKPLLPVFFAFYRTPGSLAGMTTAGPGTYIDELLTLAGGRNIFQDVSEPYPQISKETLVKRQPHIIIEPRDQQDLDLARQETYRADWRALTIPAVHNQRIYFPDQDLLLRPGPRVGGAARVLAEMIHPECFP